MPKYRIISHFRLDTLEQHINDLSDQGYELKHFDTSILFGSDVDFEYEETVFRSNTVYTAVMVKPDKKS